MLLSIFITVVTCTININTSFTFTLNLTNVYYIPSSGNFEFSVSETFDSDLRTHLLDWASYPPYSVSRSASASLRANPIQLEPINIFG